MASVVIPLGVPGEWELTFSEDFANLDAWYPATWSGFWADNVWVDDGQLHVRAAGELWSNDAILPVGSCLDRASISPAPAPSPAIMSSGGPRSGRQPGLAGGRRDRYCEGYSPTLTINYHSPSGAHNGPNPGPAGNWSNSFHVYSVVRHPSSLAFYRDGWWVYEFAPTSDSGKPQQVISLRRARARSSRTMCASGSNGGGHLDLPSHPLTSQTFWKIEKATERTWASRSCSQAWACGSSSPGSRTW